MKHKAGFVNIIGKPNVGKSTLMNAIIGEQLSIITPKAQTTRHRIIGILNEPEYQIVFSDTPGVLQPAYGMQERMMRFVESAFADADVMIYISDAGERGKIDEQLLDRLNKLEVPLLVLLNKVDLLTQEEVAEVMDIIQQQSPKATVIPVSALHRFNLEAVMEQIVSLLPEGPPYYDKEELSDRPVRFFVAEIIREKILLNYQKEIPYSSQVEIESFQEEPDIIRIRAVIYVERKSQKGILIGHQGQQLKKVGTAARKDMEKFLDQKVFLELYVKVDENWRDQDRKLDKYGYR